MTTDYESEYLEFETKVRTLIQTECPSIAETIWLEYRFSELNALDDGFCKHPLRSDPIEIDELIGVSTRARVIFYKYLCSLSRGKLQYLMDKQDCVPIWDLDGESYSFRVRVDPITPLEKVRLLNAVK